MARNVRNTLARMISTRSKQFLKLLIKNIKINIFFYLSLFSTVLLITSFKSGLQDIMINLLFSFLSPLLLLIVDTFIKFTKFTNLEGVYETYSYESDDSKNITDPYFKLKAERNGVANLYYEGGYLISLKVKSDLFNEFHWEGKADLSEANIGTLYWQYTSPKHLRDYVGYKKIVVAKQKDEATKIYLFGEDKHIPGREVLIKTA